MTRISDLIIQKAFEILKRKNISHVKFVNFEEKNYKKVLNLWKEYRFFGPNYNSFISKNNEISDLFKFHLQSPINHGIMYYSKNSSGAVIFFKIDSYFFCLNLNSGDLPLKDRNFVAIYI